MYTRREFREIPTKQSLTICKNQIIQRMKTGNNNGTE